MKTATDINWQPLICYSSAFATHQLCMIDADYIEVQSSQYYKLFCVLLFSVQFLAVVYAWFNYDGGFYLLFFVLSLLAFMISIFYIFVKPIKMVFSKKLGMFWTGSVNKQTLADIQLQKIYGELSDISIVQVIYYHRDTAKANEYHGDLVRESYQLNVIMKNGKRYNVLNSSNQVMIKQNAQILADFLQLEIVKNC